MSAEGAFTCFGALPAELRLEIWDHALSEWAVWAATTDTTEERHCESANTVPSHMKFIGPAPYVPSTSCREARRLLEQSYSKLILKPATPVTGPGAYWLDFKRTVVYLGVDTHAVDVLDSFGASTSSKFEHVSVSHDRRLFTTCRRLAASCPNLQTLIIRRLQYDSAKRTNIYRPVDLAAATQFAKIAEGSQQAIEGRRRQIGQDIRARVLRLFGDSKVKVYFPPVEYNATF